MEKKRLFYMNRKSYFNFCICIDCLYYILCTEIEGEL